MSWHLKNIETVIADLDSNQHHGLDEEEALRRLEKFGWNEIIEKDRRGPAKILWEQLTATLVLILITAAVIAGFLGDNKNLFAILTIVILYAILGLIQEYRAEKAIQTLKRMSMPNVHVSRSGISKEISARELVPGDILILETGDIIPADARLIETNNLRLQESALTGESESVEKISTVLTNKNLPLGDRINMVYMGTNIVKGRAKAVVTGTGMQTELGRIADLLQHTESMQTPLQKRLDRLGKMLALIGIAIAALIFALGIYFGHGIQMMLLTAVSVAVAIVPEGLPAVVTITLALGAQRMLKRRALIRKLPAVETLGSVTVICSDKTGTLTENKMTVVVMDVAGHTLNLTEQLKKNGTTQAIHIKGLPNHSSLSILAIAGALCNDAVLIKEKEEKYHTLGDPTEGALITAAAQMGYWKSTLDKHFPRVEEIPFDAERRRMTTLHDLTNYQPDAMSDLKFGDGKYVAITKGSVDGLLTISDKVRVNGEVMPMDTAWRNQIESANENFAKKGIRVLGVAYSMLDEIPVNLQSELESGLTFIGIFGLIDPPRKEVKEAIAMTKSAGIQTMMITGDHPLTATEIARQLAICEAPQVEECKEVMTGAELDKLTTDQLLSRVEDIRVFARVSPEHKLKIVQMLQQNGHIVSMTGDGVNDAPALRRADIGVAMGNSGTDVAREASAMVLMDDNFATIVAAVKEGRVVYDNIRKFVRFSVGGNIGKILVMLFTPFFGKSLPLIPLQLLWLNLLTDGLLGLGLGVEPAEKGVMKRKPYSEKEGIFSRGAGIQMIWIGLLIGILGLLAGIGYHQAERSEWQTMLFTTLAFAQVGQALAARSTQDSLLKIGLFSNPLMFWMALSVIVLQLFVIYIPQLQSFFNVCALTYFDLMIAMSAGIIVFLAIEINKKVFSKSVL